MIRRCEFKDGTEYVLRPAVDFEFLEAMDFYEIYIVGFEVFRVDLDVWVNMPTAKIEDLQSFEYRQNYCKVAMNKLEKKLNKWHVIQFITERRNKLMFDGFNSLMKKFNQDYRESVVETDDDAKMHE